MKNRSTFLSIVRFSLCFLYGTCVSFMVHAAPPSRVYDYTPLTTIQSDQVAANENAIFNYLQAGVDNIADGTVVNADVSGSAAITANKLNLTTITQNISNTGTLSNTGNFTVVGATSLTGDVRNLGTLVVSGASTFSAGVTSLSYALSNGNTIVDHVGAEAQGDIMYFDGTDWRTLPAGTNGHYLETNGAAANPSWSAVVTDTFAAGATYLLASLDTERSSTSATYVIRKSIAVPRSGTYRISFDITSKSTDAAKTAIGRIYKSGVAFGTERSAVDQVAYTTFSEDLAFAMGDTIDIYIKNEGGFPGGGTSYVQNFRIYATAPNTFATVTDL